MQQFYGVFITIYIYQIILSPEIWIDNYKLPRWNLNMRNLINFGLLWVLGDTLNLKCKMFFYSNYN